MAPTLLPLLLLAPAAAAFTWPACSLTFSYRGTYRKIPFTDAVTRIHSPELVAVPVNITAPYRRNWADTVEFRCNGYDVRMWTSNPSFSNLRFTRNGRTVLRASLRVAPLGDEGHTLNILATLFVRRGQHTIIDRLVPLVVAVQQMQYERACTPAHSGGGDPHLARYRAAVLRSARGRTDP